jgi:alpha/beta superfamily hydrolase
LNKPIVFSIEFSQENYQNKVSMSTRRITIASDGMLEGILRENGKRGGAVICHPHPLYGGSMYNNVVEALEEGFLQSAFTTLRFNFRGVGGSEGAYDDGNGEVQDAIAACGYMRHILGGDASLVLAGYSFGAWIAARAAAYIGFHGQAHGNLSSEHGEREGEAPAALPVEGATRAPVIAGLRDLFLVAYPFSRYDGAELRAFQGRLYFVGGAFDDISPQDQLLDCYREVRAEKYLKMLPTSHFFPGVEQDIRDFVHQMFGATSNG